MKKIEINRSKKTGIRSTLKEFHLTSKGSHLGRVVYFIDAGTQKKEFNSSESENRVWLVGIEMVDENLPNGSPNILSRQYNDSASEKSNIYKDFHTWLGVNITEFRSLNYYDLLGREVMVTIDHKPSKADPSRIFSLISSLVAPPRFTPVPPARTEPFIFDLEDYDPEMMKVFTERLTSRQREMIQASPEWEEWDYRCKNPGAWESEEDDIRLDDNQTDEETDRFLVAQESECP
jgi:hypothetical protein